MRTDWYSTATPGSSSACSDVYTMRSSVTSVATGTGWRSSYWVSARRFSRASILVGAPKSVKVAANFSTSAVRSVAASLATLLRSTVTTREVRLSTNTKPFTSRMRPRGASTDTVRVRLAEAWVWSLGASITWRYQRRAKSATKQPTTTTPTMLIRRRGEAVFMVR